MLDPQKLRVLREVARSGSIAGAADALGCTASAASQQISTLERTLGARLLERSPRSVRLTEAGRVLAERAERVLVEIESAEHAVADVAELRDGRLRVAAFSSAAGTLVVPALRTFRQRFPGIDLSFVEVEPEDAVPAIAAGEFDLAITHQYRQLPRPELHGLRQLLLHSEDLLLALPPRLHSDDRSPARLEEFADATWISTLMPVGFQALTELVCRAAGFEPRIGFRADTYDLVLAFVAADFGPALVPELVAQPRAGVAYRPFVESTQRDIHITVRDVEPSPAVAAMIDIFRARQERRRR